MEEVAYITNNKGIVSGTVKCTINKNGAVIVSRPYRTLYRLTRNEVYFMKKYIQETLGKLDEAERKNIIYVEVYISKNMNINMKHRKGKGKLGFVPVDTLTRRIGLSRQVIWYRHNKYPLQFPIYKVDGSWGVYEDEIEVIWNNGKRMRDGRCGGVKNGVVFFKNDK